MSVSYEGEVILRYGVPGYAFIGVIIALNIKPMHILFQTIGFPASLAIAVITFFSGIPFGFMISQIWWWIFESRGGYVRIHCEPRDGIRIIKDREEIKNCELEHRALPRLYFIVAEQGEYVQNAIRRLGTIYHSLRAVGLSLLLGVLAGLTLKTIVLAPYGGSYVVFFNIDDPVWMMYNWAIIILTIGIYIILRSNASKTWQKLDNITTIAVEEYYNKIRYCPYCGGRLRCDSQFCPYCGTKLIERGSGLG